MTRSSVSVLKIYCCITTEFNDAKSPKLSDTVDRVRPHSWQVVPDEILRLVAALPPESANSHEIVAKNSSEKLHYNSKNDKPMSRSASTRNIKNTNTSELLQSYIHTVVNQIVHSSHKVESILKENSQSPEKVQNSAVAASDQPSVNDTTNSNKSLEFSSGEDTPSGKSMFNQPGMKCSPVLHMCGPGLDCIWNG